MDVPLVSPITDQVQATPLVNSVDPLPGNMQGFAYLKALVMICFIDSFSFNLYNNVWNTNYIFWYPLLTAPGADEKLRFQMIFYN